MSDPENLNQVEQSSLDLKIRKYAVALAAANVFTLYGIFFISVWCLFSPQCVQFDLVSKHYIIIIGIPMSAMGAGALVTLLRSVEGPIKFKCIGFEFEGAAGQIVMFVLVFLGFVLAFSTLRHG
ncbi:MAG: hypothetical protein M3178_09510 [Pseudomonadota bacterium]|nr:hypothetical protein [Pseudomonadota bacterium]